MPTITRTIGTASRQYSTITAWEADLDNATYYSASDDAVGECYNDSTFTGQIVIASGATIGLSSIKLTAASGEAHDGTEGSGVRIQPTAGLYNCFEVSDSLFIPFAISFIEVDGNERFTIIIKGNGSGGGNQSRDFYVQNCLIHSTKRNSDPSVGISLDGLQSGSTAAYTNNVIYRIGRDSGGGGGNQQTNGIRHISALSGRTVHIHNNTICDITSDSASTQVYGMYVTAENSTALNMKNNVVFGVSTTGTGTPVDYSTVTNATNVSHNASEDSSAQGSNAVTGVSSSDFVSTTIGSHDYSLVASSFLVDAGTDLGTTPTSVNIDNKRVNRDAFAATVWDIGAHQYAVTATIGTASRNYSTLASWEADLDNTAYYGAGVVAKADFYADSTLTAGVTINGGGTVGLANIILSAPVSERHDGTAGTGVVIDASGGQYGINSTVDAEVEWLEIKNCTASGSYNVRLGNCTGAIRNVIAHGNTLTAGHYTHRTLHTSPLASDTASITNCIVYDVTNTGLTGGSSYQTIGIYSSVAVTTIANCTVHGITSDGYQGYGILNQDSDQEIINCAVMDSSYADFTDLGSVTESYNMSSDATAAGTGSLINKTASSQFVSISSGTEDFHLKAGADAIDAGTDLGATPAYVQIDINGRDRDAEGDTWDIGAHEYVSTGGTTHQGIAQIDGTSTVTASGNLQATGSALVASTSTITATGTVPSITHQGEALIASTSIVTASGSVTRATSAAIASTSSITATGQAVLRGVGLVASTSNLTATATTSGLHQGQASIDSTSSVSASGQVTARGQAQLDGTSTITATGTLSGAHQGEAVISATSSVTASGNIQAKGQALVASASSITASAGVTKQGQAVIAGTSTITATGTVPTSTQQGEAIIASASSVSASAKVTRSGITAIATLSSVTASGVLSAKGQATITALSTITAVGSSTSQAGLSRIAFDIDKRTTAFDIDRRNLTFK